LTTKLRIAIDTGGTFTDCVYLADDEVRVMKIASTPDDPGSAVLSAVRRIAGERPAEVRHGTTVGTNAILERKGARIAFVTTAGFEDTIEIGRQARPKLYDWNWVKTEPLAPASMRFGVQERVTADGQILLAPDENGLQQLKHAIAASGAEAVAISLLFSFANSFDEQRVASVLRELDIPVSVSHEVLPEFREFERGSTVCVNAYLQPKMQTYLRKLDSGLKEGGGSLQVMQSSGGITPAALAAREPVRTILSGPAGGVIGAIAVARAAGFSRILTFDMGGTSTDVAMVDIEAGLRTSTESQILGMPVAVPMLDIHTVGAGGGSLASFDLGGALKVGPESAGADPGPACCGRGQEPTVTDANLVLGRLDEVHFLGGKMRLDSRRARAALERRRGRVGSEEEFAEGIVRLSNAHMERALRKISVERGHTPRDFALVSFGGAGPLHACALAKALRIRTVLIPNHPGALSAYGILVSEVVRDYSRTVMLRPQDDLEHHFRELEEDGKRVFASERLQGLTARSVDLRYAGQGYELPVDWSAGYVDAFHREHARRYGYSDAKRPIQVVNVRVRMTAAAERIPLRRHELRPGNGGKAILDRKQIFYEGARVDACIYDRALFQPGDTFVGPAVVTEYSATTFISPGTNAQVDALSNLILEVG
jgi:N-methylhydantoinase A